MFVSGCVVSAYRRTYACYPNTDRIHSSYPNCTYQRTRLHRFLRLITVIFPLAIVRSVQNSMIPCKMVISLRWRHNGRDSVSNHQPHDCLLNRLFRRRSKKTSKLRITGLCAGNSPGTGEFPAQMASYAENVSIWWRHHVHAMTGVAGSSPGLIMAIHDWVLQTCECPFSI